MIWSLLRRMEIDPGRATSGDVEEVEGTTRRKIRGRRAQLIAAAVEEGV
jgi:hypothetical protein